MRQKIKALVRLSTFVITTFLVVSCGGNSSDSSEPAETNMSDPYGESGLHYDDEEIGVDDDFEPNEERKSQVAETSQDLYVEENFRFGYDNTVRLSVDAVDSEGEPLSGRVVSAYSVPEGVTEWTDDLLGSVSLIGKGRTNQFGKFERVMDLHPRSLNVLLVIAVVGIENKVLVPVQEGVVEYVFR